ncbi:hypothetical protein ACFP81_06565 [Deinococcus lacus]|uniref:Uncharacterized protein n=1 Tax=Deinococcus lacus TaxID=392561 RepID=A0ABW1YFR8_9DEIO
MNGNVLKLQRPALFWTGVALLLGMLLVGQVVPLSGLIVIGVAWIGGALVVRGVME